ncbi:MAG: hypothetical protein OEZ59_09895 [Deltaproteobacteria bacterium]|nr:hypothetical protein [Deltaproteobacteria bacterium]
MRITLIRLLLLALALAYQARPGIALAETPWQPFAMVTLNTTSQLFDPVTPWDKSTEETRTGNALVLEGRRLLTTAELVKNAILLEVRKLGRYPDYTARVVLVDYELNLALLTVDDDSFWAGLKPVKMSKDPVVSGRFTINRWRKNGRFEQGSAEVVELRLATSPYGLIEFPVVRGSTTMSDLGFGEALTNGDQVIGLLYRYSEGQLQAINSDLLAMFVQASKREPYSGFAHRGFSWQTLNQPHLRQAYKVESSDTGVLVRDTFPGGTGALELKKGDILHRLGGFDINPEGFIDHPSYGVMGLALLINQTLEETISAVIQRNGETLKTELKRMRYDSDVYHVSPPVFDQPIDFEVFGGLVVQELSLSYLWAWGNNWHEEAPSRLVLAYTLNSLRSAGEPKGKVVFISKVLPHPANIGYESASNAMLVNVNGKPINSLEGFREAIRNPQGGFHVLELLPGTGRGRLVYDSKDMATINSAIEARYGIPPR